MSDSKVTDASKRIGIEINHSIGTIEFTLAGKTLRFHADRAPGTQRQAAMFGWSRKISNEAAMSRSVETGLPASNEEKLEAMSAMIAHLESGTDSWSPARTAGRASSADLSLLVTALMELQPGKSKDELTAWVKSKEPAARSALMLNSKIKPIIDRLRAALASDIDADALLDELN